MLSLHTRINATWWIFFFHQYQSLLPDKTTCIGKNQFFQLNLHQFCDKVGKTSLVFIEEPSTRNSCWLKLPMLLSSNYYFIARKLLTDTKSAKIIHSFKHLYFLYCCIRFTFFLIHSLNIQVLHKLWNLSLTRYLRISSHCGSIINKNN